MDNAIEVEALVKHFGRVEALRGTSFSVKDREIFGLIGHNGAGKTTTLRILSTLISQTAGYAKVFGVDVVKEPVKIREMISYLPEEAGAYQNLSGYEYLEFMAEFYDNGDRSATDMLEEGKRIAGLDEIDGELDHVELRCDFHRGRAEPKAERALRMPEDWGTCFFYVFGEPGAQFRVIEYAE